MYHYKTNRFHQIFHPEQQIQSEFSSSTPTTCTSEGPRHKTEIAMRWQSACASTGSGMEKKKPRALEFSF